MRGERSILSRARRGVLLLGVASLLVASGCAYRFYRHSAIFLLHGASDLHARYPLAPTNPTPFDDFYVVKDGATDCSFVAVLMLMLQRDPAYASLILRETPEGYLVRFPALSGPLHVTRQDVRAHHDNWRRTREAYRWLWPGHVPPSLEILRAAYYDRQAEIGLRGRKSQVHEGGLPSQDLIILSGVRRSYSIQARCADGTHYDASFASCPAQHFQTSLRSNGRTFVTVETAAAQTGNPLEQLGALDDLLILLTTSARVPSWRGARLVPYHAYYYLGKTAGGDYVLGNPYQTRRPTVITPDEFMEYFLAVDFVNLNQFSKSSG